MGLISGTGLIILFALSFFDTILTYEWARVCIKKKPTLEPKQVESNAFIVVCWNNFGLIIGSIISGIILFGVQFLISSIHKYAFYVMVLILGFAIFNHLHNFYMLKKGRIKAFN